MRKGVPGRKPPGHFFRSRQRSPYLRKKQRSRTFQHKNDEDSKIDRALEQREVVDLSFDLDGNGSDRKQGITEGSLLLEQNSMSADSSHRILLIRISFVIILPFIKSPVNRWYAKRILLSYANVVRSLLPLP